jgi:hypothetical protein
MGSRQERVGEPRDSRRRSGQLWSIKPLWRAGRHLGHRRFHELVRKAADHVSHEQRVTGLQDAESGG